MPTTSDADDRSAMPEQRLSWLRRVHHGFREWRRLAKSLLPFVRRRVYRRLEQRHDELAAVFLGGMSPAASAAVRLVKDLDDSSQAEVCLFVSHAPQPVLKAHVVAHITQLCDAGVQVVLIVNTDLPLADIVIEPVLLARLGACVVRENLGLDFAAWAHGQQLFSARMRPRRLMLVNDSIVGPLEDAAYRALIQRMRACRADVVGLTENFDPRYHLQSFFLVFNERAIQPLLQVFGRMVNMPNKDLVIDIYETRLTQHLLSCGLRCEALFPTPARSRHAPPNDTDLRWSALVAAGFPFVKASVLAKLGDDPLIDKLVPARFREVPRYSGK
jgi:hypothetical protein